MDPVIVEVVRGSDVGLTAAEVAAKSGLLLSTARSRLDRLVDQGVLVKARASTGLPRRPPWRYRMFAPDPPATTYHRLLAGLLERLERDGEDTREDAARVGRAWGQRLAAARPPGRAGHTGALTDVMEALGFTPRRAGPQMHLTTCPYLGLVRRHPDSMCGVHAGVIQGVLDGHGGGSAVLEPFAAPGACAVRFLAMPAPRGPAGSVRQAGSGRG